MKSSITKIKRTLKMFIKVALQAKHIFGVVNFNNDILKTFFHLIDWKNVSFYANFMFETSSSDAFSWDNIN